MAIPAYTYKGVRRWATWCSFAMVLLGAGCFSSCQHNPAAFDGRGSSQAAAGYANNGYQQVPRGRRLQPLGTEGVPSNYQATPVASQSQSGQWSTAQGNNRWDTGQTWADRAQGQQANWRGAGSAWQGASRQATSHQDQRVAPPSAPADSWQSAPFYRQTQQAPAAASPGQWQGQGYVIQPGDTLSGIARRYGVPLNALLQANGISAQQVIHPGQQLAIPGR